MLQHLKSTSHSHKHICEGLGQEIERTTDEPHRQATHPASVVARSRPGRGDRVVDSIYDDLRTILSMLHVHVCGDVTRLHQANHHALRLKRTTKPVRKAFKG